MAEPTPKAKKPDNPPQKRDQKTEGNEEPAAAKPRLRDRLTTKKGLLLLLGASMLLHCAGLAVLLTVIFSASEALEPPPLEIAVGDFEFLADPADLGRIDQATFSLHIALLPQIREKARKKLDDHRYRVREEIEELLRQAHSGDFEDPTLGELKRQMQERINKTLGLRALSDVIITQLELRPNPDMVNPPEESSPATPLAVEPPG
jgi:flagellar basal body-associated protein FliL